MRTRTAVTAVVAGASAVAAFENTFPVLAWSDIKLESLSLLSPSHPTHANQRTIFASPSTPQTPFPVTPSPSTEQADLCSISTILLVSAPGLHSSDLTLLPLSHESAIRTSLAVASKTGGDKSSLSVPYVPIKKGKKHDTTSKFVKQFIADCEARLEKKDEKSLWDEGRSRTVRVEVVEGLQEWELTGKRARSKRREIVEKIDKIVGSHLASLPPSHLVILTSLPNLTSHKKKSSALTKRQYASDDDATIPTSDEESSISVDEDMLPEEDGEEYIDIDFDGLTSSTAGSEFTKPKTNGTKSIFTPDPKGGVLSRYVFFTPSLIVSLFISFVIFIPVLILTIQGLATTETVAGLESKMTGSVGLDPAKA
ncbi:hypothetical protein T439DRAFT_330209 [Meredithblackwellia eburnea MCA 4105]